MSYIGILEAFLGNVLRQGNPKLIMYMMSIEELSGYLLLVTSLAETVVSPLSLYFVNYYLTCGSKFVFHVFYL